MTGTLLVGIYVFVLAMFVGFEVITKVPPTLHTPLMSGANAISGISIVGALVIAGTGGSLILTIIGFIAVVLALANPVVYLCLPRILEGKLDRFTRSIP